MSNPLVNGNPKPQFNSEEVHYTPNGSSSYGGKLEGPRDKLREMISQLVAAGATFSYICDQSPVATIQFEFGSIDAVTGNTADEIVDSAKSSWELTGSQQEKAILSSNTPIVNYFTDAELKYLKKASEPGSDDSFPIYEGPTPEIEAAKNSIARVMIHNGAQDRIMFVPTLRSSKVVSANYQVKAALTNVGRLITTPTLKTQEAIPDGILFNLPEDTYEGGLYFHTSDFAYSWLKNYPVVQVAGRGNFTIQQEWVYGLWSTAIYGAAL